jgi:hypothetical protein
MLARETMRCFVVQDPLRRERVRFQRAGLFVVSEFRDPGTRSSMTGARTRRRRCCRHHRAFGHRSRRTIAAARASGHTLRGCGVGLAVVASAGCFVAVEVGRGS